MEQRTIERLEEVLRLLASAAAAVRLYPPASELPRNAVDRFAEAAWAVTAAGPLRFVLDPDGFRFGEDAVGASNAQIVGLAEALHALQVGQLVIAPGITTQEVFAFLQVASMDPKQVTERGGVRACLVAAGVGNLAVIEVTLRRSAEEGILGLDLTLAPLDEIAACVVDTTDAWKRSAMEGAGVDDVRTAIDRLEPATRELAARRVAQALLHMPESVRRQVLASALRPDASGNRMDGMLSVVAQMSPAALARLLTLVASDVGLRGLDLARTLELPPEVARELQMLLSPSPQSDEERGVPADPAVDESAEEMAGFDEDAEPAIAAVLAAATPTLAAGKALRTTLAVLATTPNAESVTAVAEALPRALSAGATAEVTEALAALERLAADPALAERVAAARHALGDLSLMTAVCRQVRDDTDPQGLATILLAGGAAGADAVLGCYAELPSSARPVLQRAATIASEAVIPAAGRVLRVGESPLATSAVTLLAAMGDKRALPVLAQALEHVDVNVRRATVSALADFGGDDAAALLGKALWHWDPETRRFAAMEIGRAKVQDALPSLGRIMEEIYLFDRNHDLKKEVLRSLESLGSPAAQAVLERIASRKFIAVGRKNRELQYLARQAVRRMQGSDDRK